MILSRQNTAHLINHDPNSNVPPQGSIWEQRVFERYVVCCLVVEAVEDGYVNLRDRTGQLVVQHSLTTMP
jgi:hypothetical protein